VGMADHFLNGRLDVVVQAVCAHLEAST
jgi:hypothetical protein